MHLIYATTIINGAKNGLSNNFTIENVPHLWKEKTLNELKSRGYDGDGKEIQL